jgi:hypothetical protein
MTVEHAAELPERCFWCNRRDCRASGWEQEHHAKGWQRLCGRCASTRLCNPYNALLSMRKAAEPISVPDGCTSRCWTPANCPLCGSELPPRGRSVPLEMSIPGCCDDARMSPVVNPRHLWSADESEAGQAAPGRVTA